MAGISSVVRGRAFEHSVVALLSSYRFVLKHTGGPHDRGIDFRGFWRSPDDESVPVVGQCKCINKRVGPDAVRELHATAVAQFLPTLAMLVSATGFTAAALNASRSLASAVALCTVQWTEPQQAQAKSNLSSILTQFLMNSAAQNLVPWVTVGSTHQFNDQRRRVTLMARHGETFKELTWTATSV